ncbi:PAS domain-containing protein [Poseidonibacter ostreae]|jgi:PAS domain S-box-containing protein|uniref:PAS domain-containing protein n=1 Tax=Poseidonibacter ostreae TaxID=2654171 RepID=A0A6L4WYM0_9BACT|nr:PAS domain-containing protein [Poseidonibacter ostreae]KAB7887319.1 PAS domain-containing protein [Poseidonibacter ostreae]KAB7890256.1 PAS domain-containing protein [Poseidonibacter ostreae]KAB7890836.1 PAS domain-containing protein [Poseidonibacter ostreae]MAC82938.1 histidine kinase [Arcobacter sp.]|tara:strand:+ start:1827 stop:2351 length:525 start_codon:yes stop_codon:yes gene_type:complete
MSKIVPLNEEIKLENKRYLVSETDAKGVITYCNDYFTEISGYSKEELLGKQHNIIRHPDMPKVIFKLLWERIQSGKNVNAVVKNLAKNGKYYWIFTEFKTRVDLDTNTVIGYTAHRKTISHSAIDVIAPLYAKLLEIEKDKDVESAQKYLSEFLNEKDENITFVNLLDYIHKFY